MPEKDRGVRGRAALPLGSFREDEMSQRRGSCGAGDWWKCTEEKV